jgi:DNA polymerase I
MERLHIMDGHGYIFRAYYALMNERGGRQVRLTTSSGMPTGALHVYASMLLRLYLDENPERIAVVFDAPGKSFRADLDEAYKAHRTEMPDDLRVQMPYFRPLTEAFRWPVLSVEGVEADDVIATLAHQARRRGLDVVIYSADKDLMQLVDDHTIVVDAMRQITYDAPRVKEKYGVEPRQLGDWLALVGDTSDNIPGMAGVGKVGATKLLSAYGSIDGILAHSSELKGKQRERFEDPEQLERLEISRKLVRLVDDVDLGCDLDELRRGEWDGGRLKALFEELEFQRLVDQLEPRQPGAQDAAVDPPQAHDPVAAPRTLTDEPALAAFAARAGAVGRVAVHVETDRQRPVRVEVVGVAMAIAGEPAVYVPLGHRYLSAPAQIGSTAFAQIVGPLLADRGVGKVCHDAKSLETALARLGIELRGVGCDTMISAYLLDASSDAYGLAQVAKEVCGLELEPRSELVGKGKSARGFDAVAVERATGFAGAAAAAILRISHQLEQRLAAAKLGRLADEVELPLAHVLSVVERTGILVDVAWLRSLADGVSAQIAALERRAHDIAGHRFNLGSPKQLAELLFGILQLQSPRMKKNKTGYSTDHEVLEAMRELHPIIEPILEHRELVKLKNTYIDALPPLVNPETGRVHTSFRQAVAATGRLSSSEPNLQNIPIRTELGRKIRRAFIAGPGNQLVSCDYSQIELRLLAHYCEDPVLVSAFRDDIDIHTQTAAEVFEIPRDQVGDRERRVAKAVNYGLIYGQSGFGLSRALAIEPGEAKRYIEKYFARFTRVESFLQEVVNQARRQGFSTTILGRRRPIPDLSARNFRLRSAAERVARNTPLQGSGADILKLAMLRAHELLERDWPEARMLLTVHDELVFEVPAAQAAAFGASMKQTMEAVYPLRVPMRVDVGIADTWADAH